ncbi:hypothetical protein M3Y97_00696000 [Aphelenchoides bicaudatus]|nr:hypothetical protein M3Y97_00696000 [Aphelenchoides bicaudatus]
MTQLARLFHLEPKLTTTHLLVVFMLICVCTPPPAMAVENSYFFRRNAKWINLAPSGGSLVSGRGNFRPGFYGQGGSAMYLNAFKRSAPPVAEFYPSDSM